MLSKGFQVALLVASLAVAATGGALLFTPATGAADVTITVSGTSDGTGDCSGSGNTLTCPTLRAAVVAANGLTDPVTIVLNSGTYRLEIPPATDDTAESGDLDVTKRGGALAIRGEGPERTTIAGVWSGESDRLFDVRTGATLVLEGVRLTGGGAVHDDARDHDGGAVWVGGVLQLGEVVLEENAAAGHGGAIFVASSGVVTARPGVRIVFRANSAGLTGDNGTVGNGGALAVAGTVVLDARVTFTGNAATGAGGAVWVNGGRLVLGNQVVVGGTAVGEANTAGTDGGGVAVADGVVELNGTVVRGNRAPAEPSQEAGGRGGGVWVAKGQLTLRGSTVAANAATRGGGLAIDQGSITLLDSQVRENRAALDGGGLAVLGKGTVQVVGGTFSGNVASEGDGGGIVNAGTVGLSRSVIEGNRAEAGAGGGIANSGTLELSSPETVIVRNNRARSGGGLWNGGTALLRSLVVQFNEAAQDGGGIWNRGELRLEGATVEGNRTQASGGGLWHEGNGTLTVQGNTAVRRNEAALDGGGIAARGKVTLTDVTIAENSTSGSGGGVAVAAEAAFQRAQIVDNRAGADGGGLVVLGSGKVTLADTAVRRNSAGQLGGGVAVRSGGQLAATASSVTENQAVSYGGGIAVLGAVTATNVTVSTNVSQHSGGGIWAGPQATVSLGFVTLAANAAAAGGALYNDGGAVTLRGTLIAGSPGGGNCGGLAPVSQGSNLEDRDSCVLRGSGDLVNTAPLLQPLRVDPVGGTLFHALGLGSPALDAAGTEGCPADDQLHTKRPQGDACDIGAFEYPVPEVTPLPTAAPTETVVEPTPVTRPVTPVPDLGDSIPIIGPGATPTPTIGLPATGASEGASSQRVLGLGLLFVGLSGVALGSAGFLRSGRRTEQHAE